MQSLKDLLKDKDKFTKKIVDKHKYVTQEFQDYGYRIALKLGEQKNVSLYIKLAKQKPRALLEQAFSFAIDYPNAKNRGRLFMWKLKELEGDTNKKNSPDSVKKKQKKRTTKVKRSPSDKRNKNKKASISKDSKAKASKNEKDDKNSKSDIIQLLDV